MSKKTFSVEIKKTTYCTIEVEAKSAKDAQDQVVKKMESYTYQTQLIGTEKLNLNQNESLLKVISCNPLSGTTHMNNDEFGEYIKNS